LVHDRRPANHHSAANLQNKKAANRSLGRADCRDYQAPPRRRTSLEPCVFTWNGKCIKEFRAAWRKACIRANCSGRHFHDLRRTAIRDLIRSGVSQSVAMSISGHRTISIFQRYKITDIAELTKPKHSKKWPHTALDSGNVFGYRQGKENKKGFRLERRKPFTL
jgi:integrase